MAPSQSPLAAGQPTPSRKAGRATRRKRRASIDADSDGDASTKEHEAPSIRAESITTSAPESDERHLRNKRAKRASNTAQDQQSVEAPATGNNEARSHPSPSPTPSSPPPPPSLLPQAAVAGPADSLTQTPDSRNSFDSSPGPFASGAVPKHSLTGKTNKASRRISQPPMQRYDQTQAREEQRHTSQFYLPEHKDYLRVIIYPLNDTVPKRSQRRAQRIDVSGTQNDQHEKRKDLERQLKDLHEKGRELDRQKALLQFDKQMEEDVTSKKKYLEQELKKKERELEEMNQKIKESEDKRMTWEISGEKSLRNVISDKDRQILELERKVQALQGANKSAQEHVVLEQSFAESMTEEDWGTFTTDHIGMTEQQLEENDEKLAKDQEKLQGDQEKLEENQEKLKGDQEKLAKDQEKLAKDQEKLAKDQEKLAKDQEKLAKDQEKLAKDHKKLKGDQEKLEENQDGLTRDRQRLAREEAFQKENQEKLREQLAVHQEAERKLAGQLSVETCARQDAERTLTEEQEKRKEAITARLAAEENLRIQHASHQKEIENLQSKLLRPHKGTWNRTGMNDDRVSDLAGRVRYLETIITQMSQNLRTLYLTKDTTIDQVRRRCEDGECKRGEEVRQLKTICKAYREKIQLLGRCLVQFLNDSNGVKHYARIINDTNEKLAPMIHNLRNMCNMDTQFADILDQNGTAIKATDSALCLQDDDGEKSCREDEETEEDEFEDGEEGDFDGEDDAEEEEYEDEVGGGLDDNEEQEG